MPGLTVASVTASSARRGPREPRRHAPRTPQQLAGCILWLPPKAEIRGGHESDLEADRCNHPVVVLSPHFVDGKVVYLMLTSLRNRDLTECNYPESIRREHLPIRPANPHPDNGKILYLADPTLQLSKKSYVKTKVQHQILFTSLRPYAGGPDYNLSKQSYQDLIEYARYIPPPPHPASNTVTSPRRALFYDPVVPTSRERRGSYSEFVSAQRGLDYHTPITNTAPTRVSRPAAERDPLMPTYGRSYTDLPGRYPGSYPPSPPAGSHPILAYRAAARANYQGLGSPAPETKCMIDMNGRLGV
ncbi:hypothetical protein F5Y04DRAFT_53061 [Hypomontagnella monticulosa]|nr:hypothetical protein F5Y04DRAFT_53061 [Hypomontagnella monticulosa]